MLSITLSGGKYNQFDADLEMCSFFLTEIVI